MDILWIPVGNSVNIVELNYSHMNKIEILDLESVMMNNESLKKILEDGVVTENEIKGQVEKVTTLAEQLEQICSEEQLKMIQSLIAEMNALYVAYNYNELLSIR